MKRKQLEKKLNKIQTSKSKNTIKIILPLFVLLIIVGIGFSFSLPEDNSYIVRINIINGYEELFIENVHDNVFSAYIDSDYKEGNVTCSKGNLSYDNETSIISGKVTSDVLCTLEFDKSTYKTMVDLKDLNRINDNFGTSYYYKRSSNNNYFLYNDDYYRIIRINSNGSFRLMKLDSIANINYDKEEIYRVLNNWYENKNINALEMDYDNNTYNNNYNSNLINLDGYDLLRVGLISVNEVNLICGGVDCANSYLSGNYYTSNDDGVNSIVVKDGLIDTYDNEKYEVRPVINIEVNKLIGDGTINNPYIIE